MAKLHSFWVIIDGAVPTAFRARNREELLPTLTQLKRTQPNVVLMWFERGRVWESPAAARAALEARRQQPRPRDRKPEWRPGGDHRDPRAKYQISRDEKRARFKKRRDFEQRRDNRPGGEDPASRGGGERPFRGDRRPPLPQSGRPPFPKEGRPPFPRDSRPPFPRDGRPPFRRDDRPREDRFPREDRSPSPKARRPPSDRDSRTGPPRERRPPPDRQANSEGRSKFARDGRPDGRTGSGKRPPRQFADGRGPSDRWRPRGLANPRASGSSKPRKKKDNE